MIALNGEDESAGAVPPRALMGCETSMDADPGNPDQEGWVETWDPHREGPVWKSLAAELCQRRRFHGSR
jgi:hypothetical protein